MAVNERIAGSSINYFDNFFRAENLSDPYPLYHRVRAEEPVHWSEAWGYWVLTRYADVLATLRDPRLSHYKRITKYIDQLPGAEREELQPICQHYAAWLGFMDPPDHTRLRALVNKAFTPRMIEGLRPRIQGIVDDLIQTAKQAGQMDIIRDFAFPLPISVIMGMFGLPITDRVQFRRWSNDMIAFIGSGRINVEVARKSQQSMLEISEYVRQIVQQHRLEPQDDLLSALIAVQATDSALSDEEIVGTCVSFVMAGHETTTNLIANGLLALMRNPDQMQIVQEKRVGISTVIEELLRYDSPVQRHWGVATEAIDVAGQRIEAGEVVVQLLGAANRDPEQFPEPDRLDVTRRENRHVSFGYGPRFCIGAPLARVEAQIAIQTLLEQVSGLEVTSETLAWNENMAFRGVKSLPVVFH